MRYFPHICPQVPVTLPSVRTGQWRRSRVGGLGAAGPAGPAFPALTRTRLGG